MIKALSQIRIHQRAFWLILTIAILMISITSCGTSTPSSIPPATIPETSSENPVESVLETPLSSDTPSPSETPFPTTTATSSLPPTPPLEPIGGIELHKLTDKGGFSLLKGTKTYWIRLNGLFWEDVEPSEGERNWEALAELEAGLQSASEQGYQVILIITNAPTWARSVPDYPCSAVLPEKLPAFASFVQELVARYSVPPYNVKYWELGNEPDVDPKLISPTMPFGCWGNDQDEYYGGGYYADMLKTVYPQIKAVDPQAQVLVGGLLLYCDPINPPETSPGSGEYADCTPSKFLEGALRNGGGDYFDGVSFHAYDYYLEPFKYGNGTWHSSWDTTGPTFIAKAKYLRSLLGVYGYANKFLINSETAIICGRDGSEPECQTPEFDQSKATYAAQSFAATLAEGLRGTVWYSITGWRGSGLTKGDMQPTYASTGYAFSLEMLDQAAYRGEITDFPGIFGYRFEKNGQDLWVLWSIAETPQSIELPAMPQAIFDVFGNPLPTDQTIEVGSPVLYIKFAP